MPDAELVSRSLLLLQYRLAIDMMPANKDAAEHATDDSLLAAPARRAIILPIYDL
jgi:hypothetical protein